MITQSGPVTLTNSYIRHLSSYKFNFNISNPIVGGSIKVTFPTDFFSSSSFDQYTQGSGIQNILGLTMTGSATNAVDLGALAISLTGVTTSTGVK